MSSPERMCIGCRGKRERDELIRLQLREGGAVAIAERPSGRGAYLCPERACFEAALRRGAFARAFRSPSHVDEGLWQDIEVRASERARERR